MLVGSGPDLLGVIVHLDQAVTVLAGKRKEEDKSVIHTIPAMQYRWENSLDDHTHRHKDFETVDDNMLDTDWQDNVNRYKICQKPLEQLRHTSKFSKKVGWMFGAHWNSLTPLHLITPELYRMNCALYCSGQKVWEFQKAWIDKMLFMKVINLAQAEQASQIVFTPKKDS